MPDEPDPPRKFYTLKPREFERVNPPASGDAATPPDVAELARIASRGDVRGRPAASAASPNEVHAMLQLNHAADVAAGLNEPAPAPPRVRRRRRDYLLLLFAGNLFIVVIYAVEIVLGFQVQCLAARMPGEFYNLLRYAWDNPASYALTFVGIGFFSIALTWLMYGVMDDY